jgi:hypothetical protein
MVVVPNRNVAWNINDTYDMIEEARRSKSLLGRIGANCIISFPLKGKRGLTNTTVA